MKSGAPEARTVEVSSSSRCGGADKLMLEGLASRTSELIRFFRILRDVIRGVQTLHFVGPSYGLGSARAQSGDTHYELAHQLGLGIARMGFPVMTGRAPCIMEPANRGAKEVGGFSFSGAISSCRSK